MASKKLSQFILVWSRWKRQCQWNAAIYHRFQFNVECTYHTRLLPICGLFSHLFVWRHGISTALILLLSDYHTCCKQRGSCDAYGSGAFGTISTSSKIYIDKFFLPAKSCSNHSHVEPFHEDEREQHSSRIMCKTNEDENKEGSQIKKNIRI